MEQQLELMAQQQPQAIKLMNHKEILYMEIIKDIQQVWIIQQFKLEAQSEWIIKQ